MRVKCAASRVAAAGDWGLRMTYAVLQRRNEPMDSRALAKAFKASGVLTALDAAHVARHGFGFIADKLALPEARTLQAALAEAAIEAAVVDSDDLLSLPAPRRLRRLDCLAPADGGLRVYDALGRPEAMGYEHVLVIAAGMVHAPRSERVSGLVLDASGEGAAIAVEESTRHTWRDRLLLNIITDLEPARYLLDADQCLYNYLGARRTHREHDNFATLLGDLAQHATHAVLNQGTVSLLNGSEQPLRYRSPQAFERELVWLVWLSMGAKAVGA